MMCTQPITDSHLRNSFLCDQSSCRSQASPVVVAPAVVAGNTTTTTTTSSSSSSSSSINNQHGRLVQMSLRSGSTRCRFGSGLNGMEAVSSSFADGWNLSGQMDALRGKVCLYDSKGSLLAVVVRQQLSGYEILCPTPAYEGQEMHNKVTIKSSKAPLYKWASVKSSSALGLVFSSTYTITNEATKEVYTSKECGSWIGSRVVKICKAESGQPCALIRQKFENGAVCRPAWDVLVGTDGICPKIVLCLLAAINKTMGV